MSDKEQDRPIICSASVMCADLGRLEDDLKALEEAGCEELHFDIMDGLFVPNFTLGFDFIKTARNCCDVPCNGHLMITHPADYIDRFIEAGCDSVTIHLETTDFPQLLLERIREGGASPGIGLNPATPLSKLDYLLDYADRVMLMTVDPGYAGQKIIPGAFDRVRILREHIDHRQLDVQIEVDGNIDVRNAAMLSRMGADIFVLGTSSIFKGEGDLQERLLRFRADVVTERKRV